MKLESKLMKSREYLPIDNLFNSLIKYNFLAMETSPSYPISLLPIYIHNISYEFIPKFKLFSLGK